MKNLIFIFLTFFILTGCSTSSLKLNKGKELILNYNSNDLLLTNELVDSDFLNFKDLFVSRYKLQNKKGRVLFYEDAKTSLSFEFTNTGLYTFMYVLNDIQKYELVYKRNNLELVQVLLKNKTYLNVMIQASDSQVYSYVYGFSNKEFNQIAQKIKVNKNDKIQELKHEGVIFESSSKYISNWNDEIVFFTPLITPLRMLGGR
jgi:hypothetical protein